MFAILLDYFFSFKKLKIKKNKFIKIKQEKVR